jgi:shikimate 5-dehydrogenase
VGASEAVVTQIKETTLSNVLMTNESKTKYMKIKKTITNLEQDLRMNGQVFEGVKNFRHLGALINSKNLISDEIKSRIAAGNMFYSLR